MKRKTSIRIQPSLRNNREQALLHVLWSDCLSTVLERRHSGPATEMTGRAAWQPQASIMAGSLLACFSFVLLLCRKTVGEKGLSGLSFQITIHHEGKSGQEVKMSCLPFQVA